VPSPLSNRLGVWYDRSVLRVLALLLITRASFGANINHNDLVLICRCKDKWVVQVGKKTYHSRNKELPPGIRKVEVVPGGAKFWTKSNSHPTFVLLGHQVPIEDGFD
jgi:hypothetical protein